MREKIYHTNIETTTQIADDLKKYYFVCLINAFSISSPMVDVQKCCKYSHFAITAKYIYITQEELHNVSIKTNHTIKQFHFMPLYATTYLSN